MTTARPRVALLTTVDFWAGGAGHRERIRALAQALSRRLTLTVVMPTALPQTACAAISKLLPEATLHTLDLAPSGQQRDALSAFAAFFRTSPQDACLIEYLSLGWLRTAVPKGVMTLVDTHDVVHRRDAELLRLGDRLDRPLLTAEDERRQLQAFDRVIAISEPDAELFRSWLANVHVLLAPHAHPLRPAPWRHELRRLLFVGSGYLPNQHGLHKFLHEVWPRLMPLGLQLDVVGQVGPAMRLRSVHGVQVRGQVDDLDAAYDAADLCINPVQVGSGLKIKSVEALAHGLPLVATPHAVRGLAGGGEAFLVAQDSASFATSIQGLAEAPGRRQALVQGALRLAHDQFSEEACYGELFSALGAP